MRLSVGEALASGRLGGVTLVAGNSGLHRVVTRMKICRDLTSPVTIPDQAIVLVQDDDRPGSAAELTGFIHGLSTMCVSALIVREGLIDQEVLCAANAQQLPLLTIQNDHQWTTTIQSLQRDLLLVQVEIYERVQEIHDALTHVVIAGHGLDEIARVLANLVNNPVVIEDHRFEVLAWNNNGVAPDSVRKRVLESRRVPVDVLDVLAQKGVLQRISTEKKPFHVPPIPQLAMQARVMAPIVVGNVRYGHISIAESRRALGALDLMAIEQAATLVTLQLSLLRSIKEREERLAESLVYDILFNYDQAEVSIRQRANFLGYALATRYTVIVIAIDDFSTVLHEREWGQSAIHTIKETLRYRIDESLGSQKPSALLASSGNACIVLYPLCEGDTLAGVRGYAQRLRVLLLDTLSQLTFSIGIGRICATHREIAQSYRDAQLAISVGRASRGGNFIITYDELGIYSLLMRYVDEPLLAGHVRRTLGALFAYDAEHDAQLLKTLRRYLQNGGNKRRTAEDLYVHLNTVKYRLQKISELLRVNLDDPDELLNLHLCVKMADLSAKQTD